MSTTSIASIPAFDDTVCQGDIFKNVKYSYIDSESDDSVDVIEYEFPLAVVISQACDVVAMDEIVSSGKGKPTKFMPSILLCPIYDKNTTKSGEYVYDVFDKLSLSIEKDPVCSSSEWKVAQKDWHYRFHALEIKVDDKTVIKDSAVDFKHYFSVPMSYLVSHKEDRVYHLDDLFAEQLTLKFATYLSRVAIPD